MPTEWDYILGTDPKGQSRMLAQMLRQQQITGRERAIGDVVGLTGGKSFAPWGDRMAERAQQDEGRAALEARARMQMGLQARQMAQQAANAKAMQQYRDAMLRENARHHQAMEAQARLDAQKKAEQIEIGYRDLPPDVRKELDKLDDHEDAIKASFDALEAYPTAFGMLSDVGALGIPGIGKVAGAIQTNYTQTPDETWARSVVFTLPAQIVTDLFGAAFTQTEEAKARFIPMENDKADKIAVKLQALGQEIGRRRSTRQRNYGVPENAPRSRPAVPGLQAPYGGAQTKPGTETVPSHVPYDARARADEYKKKTRGGQ